MKNTSIGLVSVLFSILLTSLATGFAQGTAFTYQGRLNTGGGLAGGSYDLAFKVYDTNAPAGNLVAGPVTNSAVVMSNGLFVVTLDFGTGVFTGPNRWLEIAVRTNGAGAFFTLTPRQQITATPYAIMANGASNLLGTVPAAQLSGSIPATQISGVIPSADISGTYGNAVAFNNGADTFSGTFNGQFYGSIFTGGIFTGQFLGDGSGLSGLWRTGGNTGTTPGLNFIGTTDNQPLELKVNGTRILRLEPDPRGANAGNLIGGFPGNAVEQPGSGSDFIGSGGYPGIPNTIHSNSSGVFIGGGSINQVGPNVNDSVIVGGYGNTILSWDSLISGGVYNVIQTNAPNSAIVGGYQNIIQNGSGSSVISGGQGNLIEIFAGLSVIGGGLANDIQSYADQSVIGGGNNNRIYGGARESFIGGGYLNTIQYNSLGSFIGDGFINTVGINATGAFIGGGLNNTNAGIYSFIGGGDFNLILAGADEATVVGGENNSILGSSVYAVISGGNLNVIQPFNFHSTISGGSLNVLQTNAHDSVIAGGYQNFVGASANNGVIGGGYTNVIQTNAQFATIGGGSLNQAGGSWAVVPGGYGNTASALQSFAAGTQAQATNAGSFVLTDLGYTNFYSTTSNQLSGRFTGGVRLVTGGAGMTLDGPVRLGSETGTSNAPSPAGLVIRRVNSLSTTVSNVIARSDVLTLERDGTTSGLLIRYPAGAGSQTVNCIGMNNVGGSIFVHTNVINPVSAGTIQLVTAAQRAVQLQVSFGNTRFAGHVTQVVIDRYDDGTLNDNYWVGTVTSTFNQ